MDVHVRAVAILHIIFGALTLVGIALVGLFFGALIALVHPNPPYLAVVASLGAVVAVPYAIVAIGQMVAALYLLRGSAAARIDDKGRLKMPAEFAEELGRSFTVTKGPSGCLWVLPDSEWQAMSTIARAASVAKPRPQKGRASQ